MRFYRAGLLTKAYGCGVSRVYFITFIILTNILLDLWKGGGGLIVRRFFFKPNTQPNLLGFF